MFPEPEALAGELPSLIGTDGKGKMSKSAGNAIMLGDDPKAVARKIRGTFTDPNRVTADVPGTVEGNPVFVYHDAFNDDRAQVDELKARYREGRVGDVEVKQCLVEALERFMQPIRERMAHYGEQKGLVEEILVAGTERVQGIARETMRDVRRAMGIDRTMVRARRALERRHKKTPS